MKACIEQSKASDLLAIAARYAAKHTSLQACKGVLIEARAGDSFTTPLLTFSASDAAGSHVVLQSSADVTTPGKALVDSRRLAEIVAGMSAGPIMLSEDKSDNDGLSLKVASKGSRYHLTSIDPEDFPEFGECQESVPVRVDAPELAKALGAVTAACSHDYTKPILTGVYVELKDLRLSFTATDTHFLVRKSLPAINFCGGEFEPFVLSRDGADSIAKLAALTGGTVAIRCDGTKAQAECGPHFARFPLVEGQFPNYERVIDLKFVSSAVVDRHALLQALKAGRALEDEHNRCSFSASGMFVSVKIGSSTGSCSSEIDCGLDGEAFTVDVSRSRLETLLARIDSNEVRVSFKDNLSAVRLQAEDEKDPLSYILLMPLVGAK